LNSDSPSLHFDLSENSVVAGGRLPCFDAVYFERQIMLKRVTVTRHETVDTWNSWIVSVPDDMDDERIQELMLELWEKRELDLDEEERQDEGEPSVDISEAPSGATTPNLTLTENGLVDEETVITAFTTELLQAELERRRAKECDTIVV
jgi:hypothetical protein